MNGNHLAVALVVLGLVFGSPHAAGTASESPSAKDRCPVCGMFVAKYPDWLASITFNDGATVYFDGPKDMFKFYFNMARYAPGKTMKDIASIRVTHYYDVRPVDARSAWYVMGSNVYGPMGRELIPFESEDEARDFAKDHGGDRILRFSDINPALIASLD